MTTAVIEDSGAIKPSRRRLPFWALMLSSLVLLTIVGTICGAFSVFMYTKQLSELSQKPEYMAQTLSKICEFKKPFPTDWQNLTAVDIPALHFSTVTLQHAKDEQQVVLTQSIAQTGDTAKAILGGASGLGINTFTRSARFQEMKSQGELTVGGRKMPYIVGRFIERNGHSMDGLVGCIAIPEQKKNILIFAYPADKSTYNHDESVEVLNAVERF